MYTDGLAEARHHVDGTFFPLRRMAAPALSSGTSRKGSSASSRR